MIDLHIDICYSLHTWAGKSRVCSLLIWSLEVVSVVRGATKRDVRFTQSVRDDIQNTQQLE